jgi:hypothetical protein
MRHRDNHLSDSEIVQGLLSAWEQRVAPLCNFLLTEADVAALVDQAPAQLILQSFTNTATVLKDQSSYWAELRVMGFLRSTLTKEIQKIDPHFEPEPRRVGQRVSSGNASWPVECVERVQA